MKFPSLWINGIRNPRKDIIGVHVLVDKFLQVKKKIVNEKNAPSKKRQINNGELIDVKFPLIQKTPCFKISST